MGVDDSLITRAIEIFEPKAGRPLTREEGRAIVQNLTTFFQILGRVDMSRAAGADQTDGPGSADKAKTRPARARRKRVPA